MNDVPDVRPRNGDRTTPPARHRPTSPPSFATGALLAGRYRILRFIAQGGMGEVYEAEDLELREHVALKTVRPQAAQDDPSAERFRREIQMARRVAHRNVCRIFDSGVHRITSQAPGRPGGKLLFLTMELLEGETLERRLRSRGPMSGEAALPLVRQMAEALQAAHDVGVVHRDFKSSNVMLVPSSKLRVASSELRADPELAPRYPVLETPELRAVVTDFGLAKAAGGDKSDVSSSLTGEGVMLGTPETMAPEQVEGKSVGPAADIYALGVVLYEMVTGRLPFVGSTQVSTAMKRLHETPVPPSQQALGLSARWDAVILRCLERDPADRFQTAAEVARGLEGTASMPARRFRRRTARRLAAGLAILLAAGLLAGLRWSRSVPGPVPRRAVAVLGFKNLSGRADTAWISTALAEMASTELSVVGADGGAPLRVIPGENVARMKIDLQLGDAESLAADTLARIRQNVGAEVVILGSYLDLGSKTGGQIRLDLRLQETRSGETLLSVAEMGSEERLDDLATRAGAHLRAALGAQPRSQAESAALLAFLPSGPEATRLYAEGLARLRHFDPLSARNLLERAVAVEPQSPLLHSALAQAWSDLGHDARAQEAARKAFDLSAKLPRAERLLVEGRYREVSKDWDKAVEIYGALFTVFPDEIDLGLRLAKAQSASGRGPAAFDTVARLRGLPSVTGPDPRIDLAEAEAAWLLADFGRSERAATRALERGAALGARHLVAQASYWQGNALQTEDPKRAQLAYEEAIRIWAGSGNRKGEAEAQLFLARVLWIQGDLARATRTIESALAICRSIGQRAGFARGTRLLGLLLSEQGRLGQALGMYRESLAACREIRERHDEAWALNNLGDVLWKQGELAAAQEPLRSALELWLAQGNDLGVETARVNLGEVHFSLGELAEAERHYEEAYQGSGKLREKLITGYSLFGLGKVAFARGDLARARAMFRQSLELREAAGQKGWSAESRLALAALDLEEGRPLAAEAAAREAVSQFHEWRMDFDETEARALLARALLALGRRVEAQEEILRAEAQLGSIEYRAVRLSVGIAAAGIRAASGQREDLAAARKSLETSLADATQAGYREMQLEARLVLAVLSEKDKAALETLEKEAAALGFGRIASKAAAARI